MTKSSTMLTVKRSKKLKKFFIFPLIALILIVAGTEISLRLFGSWINKSEGPHKNWMAYWLCNAYIHPSFSTEILSDYTTIGAHIFPAQPDYYRIDKPLSPKPEGTIRIICMGDSSTYGEGVNEVEPYSQVLQRVLPPCYPQKKIEVWNLGRKGYSSYQGMLLAEKIWEDARPDVLVYYFGANDTRIAPIREDKEWANVPYWAIKLHWAFYQKSTFYRLIRNINIYHLRRKVHMVFRKEGPPPTGQTRVSADDFLANRKAIRQRAEKTGCQMINVLYASIVDGKAYYTPDIQKSHRHPNDVDLAEIFDRELLNHHMPLLDSVHPTPRGHLIIARAIFEKISDLWGPPSCDQEEQFRAERETLRERYSFLPYP